jgi:general secretion pathway protein J
MRAARGFTLIELLVALSIMATMTLMAWWSVNGMTRAVGQAQQQSDDVLALQSGVDQWVMDLEAVQTTPETRAILWDGRSLRMTRRHGTDSSQGLTVVAWTLRKTPRGAMWSRWQSPTVRNRAEWGNAWQAASDWAQISSTETRQLEVTVAPLEQWQVLFFSNGNWASPLLEANGSNGPDPGVPNGVRLMLSVAQGHPLQGLIQRDWVRPTLTGGVR